MNQCIVFTGGGTAGHVYPGLAVAESLKKHGAVDCHWIGSRRGMERAIVERAGLPYHAVPAGKLRRYFSVQNLADLFRIASGLVCSLLVLARLRPALLFSKGGYVSVPPVVAAGLLGIPVFTHESDLDPGLATLLNAPFAARILVAYEESRERFPPRHRAKLVVTGNPVRRAILEGSAERGLRALGFSGARPVVLVMGGSQGAAELNGLVDAVLEELLRFCDLVHQCGPMLPDDASRPGYRRFSYLGEELPDCFAAASLIVSRAGAGSIWEALSLAKPTLLIPLRGFATRGDQVRNAEHIVSQGLAKSLCEDTIEPSRFLSTVRNMVLSPDAAMIERLSRRRPTDAAARIAGLILKEVAGDVRDN